MPDFEFRKNNPRKSFYSVSYCGYFFIREDSGNRYLPLFIIFKEELYSLQRSVNHFVIWGLQAFENNFFVARLMLTRYFIVKLAINFDPYLFGLGIFWYTAWGAVIVYIDIMNIWNLIQYDRSFLTWRVYIPTYSYPLGLIRSCVDS